METVAQDPREILSMEILKRLDTAGIYETIHQFQRSWSYTQNSFTHNEMRLSEQIRFSNAINLAQMKQEIYQHPQLRMLHHINHYETGVIQEIPRSEEQVLSQAAVAALVSAVDNTVVQVLNRPGLHQENWLRLEQSLWQTAENSINRYGTYHNEYSMPAVTVRTSAETAWNQ